MGTLSGNRLFHLCLTSATSLTLTGCRSAPLGPVVGYTGTILQSSAVPGRPGGFRLLIRVRSTDGQPVSDPPNPAITVPTAGGASRCIYSARRVSGFTQPYCDMLILGQLPSPLTAPTSLIVDLEQLRLVPVWKRLVSHGSTAPYSEVGARTRVGTFTLKPSLTGSVRPSGGKKPAVKVRGQQRGTGGETR